MTTLLCLKLLALHDIGTAVRIYCNDTSNEPIIITGKKPTIARHHAVEDEVNGNDVLLATVTEDNLHHLEGQL